MERESARFASFLRFRRLINVTPRPYDSVQATLLRGEYAFDPPQTGMALYRLRSLLVAHYNRETATLIEADG